VLQVLHWCWSAGWSPEQWQHFRHQLQQEERERATRSEVREDEERQDLQQLPQQKESFRTAALRVKAQITKSSQSASAAKKIPPVLDHVSDVFSWGLLVVELFAGR
jgi:hypothetical protein